MILQNTRRRTKHPPYHTHPIRFEKKNHIKCYYCAICILLISALDKLLGQLGIYATWLSSIAYLQKQLRIFMCFFYAMFFFL